MRGSTVKNRRSNNIVEQAVNHAEMCRSDCQPLRPDAAPCCSNNEHQFLPITPANTRRNNVFLAITKNSEQCGYNRFFLKWTTSLHKILLCLVTVYGWVKFVRKIIFQVRFPWFEIANEVTIRRPARASAYFSLYVFNLIPTSRRGVCYQTIFRLFDVTFLIIAFLLKRCKM